MAIVIENSADFYKGRESVWKDLYTQMCNHAGKQEEEVKRLGEALKVEIDRDSEFRKMRDRAYTLEKMQETYPFEIQKLKDDFFELLDWVMSRDNRSAEERLSDIRKKYKDIFEELRDKNKRYAK